MRFNLNMFIQCITYAPSGGAPLDSVEFSDQDLNRLKQTLREYIDSNPYHRDSYGQYFTFYIRTDRGARLGEYKVINCTVGDIVDSDWVEIEKMLDSLRYRPSRQKQVRIPYMTYEDEDKTEFREAQLPDEW